MTYVIGSGCTDEKDRSCLDVCPVDCIAEGGDKMYIDPSACIDCGACEPECPNDAIFHSGDVPPGEQEHVTLNAAFFGGN